MRFRDQLYGTTSKMRRVNCFDLHELGDMKYRPLSRFELIVHIPIELPPLVPRGLDALRMGLYHELYCSTTMWPYLLFMYKLRDPIPKNTMNCECQWQAVAGVVELEDKQPPTRRDWALVRRVSCASSPRTIVFFLFSSSTHPSC